MSDSPVEALLLRARDHEAASWRWRWGCVALVAAAHLTVVAPFVESSRRRQAAAEAAERLAAVAAALAELEAHVGSEGVVVEEVMLPALERLPEEVASDLGRLAATYRFCAEVVAEGGGAAAEDAGAAAEERGGAEEEPAAGDAEPFRVESVDRILTIGEAATRDELVAALTPLVEERVEGPRFGELRRLWSSSAVPRIEASLEGVAARVPELRGRFGAAVGEAPGAAEAAWQELGEALAAERRTVRDLAWEPPERRDWWALAEPDPGELVATRLDPAVGEQLRRPLALDQLEVSAARTESAYEEVVRTVEAERDRRWLEARPEGSADVLGGPAAERLARAFPPLLGAVLAALTVAAARRRRELGLLVHLIDREGASPGIRDWYFQRPRWTAAPDPAPLRERAARRSGWLRIAALTLAGLAWIGLAAYQLAPVEPFERLVASAAAGALALLAAAAYDVAVTRALHRLLGRTGVPPPPAPAAEPAGEPRSGEIHSLGGHSLRR